MAGISALLLSLLYLLASTQLALPIREWLEAEAETPVQREAFACAIHKCQCQNALQCKVHCCCFPKASAQTRHSHDGDGLAAHWSQCGGDGHDHGLMPLSPHIQTLLTAVSLPVRTGPRLSMAASKPPSPLLESPSKVPI